MKTVRVGNLIYEDLGTGTLVAVGEVEGNGRPARRTSWTAAELLADEFPEPRFAVDGLLPEGLTFMCGAPKLGKSWMALGLGIAVASGGRALGSVSVEAGDALYLALEDSPRRLQSRLRTLLSYDQAPERLHLETAWPRLDEGGTDNLDRWLDEHPDARAVLIDVWPRIRPRVTKRTDYYLSGGVDGAIARSSEASMAIEKRLREVRARKPKSENRRYSYQELRASNITTTSGGVGLIPVNGAPRYIAEAFADQARVKARLAYRLLQGQLPPSGNIVLVPRATTGAVVAVQSAENVAVTDTAMVTDTTTSPVATITGMQQVSRQLLDRGINVDVDIAASLGASFGGILEAQVLNGSGASGQLTGLLGVTGITANSYTDATATAAEAFGAIQKLLSDTGTAYGAPVDTLVMHSRRARWLSDNAVFGTNNYGAEVLETQGVPTNLGAGTNQDAILAMALQETPVYIGPVNFAVQAGVLSNTLQVRILAWAYVALAGGRLPTSIGALNGTGLITPVFP